MLEDSVSHDPSQSGEGRGAGADPVQLAAHRSLSEALRLAEHGYALTPVTITRLASGKKGARFHKGWRHESAWSADPDQVRAWWVEHGGCSFALGGAANGIEGTDLDVKPGADGELGVDAVAWWGRRALPTGALVQRTPSGGEHHIWASPDGVGLPQEAGKTVGKGVDTRNRSGLFFAAGSYVLGLDGVPEHGHYEVVGELVKRADLAPTPARVLALFADAPADGPERPADGRIVVKDRDWVRAETVRARKAIAEHDRTSGGYRAKIQHLAMFYGRVVELGELTAEAAEADWLGLHRALWGPTVFPENLKDFRDALAAGPALERWRYRDPTDGELVTGTAASASDSVGETVGVLGHPERVELELRKIRARREAERTYAREVAPPDPGPQSTSLAALLVEPDDGVDFRFGELWPTGGKVLMSAPPKAGKTTMVGNVVKALADGPDAGRFLGRPPGQEYRADEWRTTGEAGFAVTALEPGRRVFILDFEMTRRTLKRWFRDLRLAHPDRVEIEEMRGRRWDPRDDLERARWAEHLRALNVGVLIIDPIGPILQALGVEENSPTEVGVVLTALDMLVREAGIGELFVVQHTGHEGERARGASTFLGWPDAIWYLTRDPMTDARALRAEGRDVALRETLLTYDRESRRLGLGQGDRASARHSGDAEVIGDLVSANPGATQRELRSLARDTEIGTKVARAQDAVKAAVDQVLVHVHQGPNRAQHHYPGQCSDGCFGAKSETRT